MRREHWRSNIRLTGLLLAIWFLVTFLSIWFARELNEIVMAGFPLAFYMGAQGTLLIYLILVWVYARRMDDLDEECDLGEPGR